MGRKWTYEELKEQASRYKTRGEFRKNNIRAYGAAHEKKIIDDICSHMPKHVYRSGENSPTLKYSNQQIYDEALKYTTKQEFKKGSSGHYRAAIGRKIIDDVCSHMPKHVYYSGQDSPVFKWTDEMVREKALQCKTKGDFREKNPAAYNVALKRRILDDICSHMNHSVGISSPERDLFNLIKERYPKTQRLKDRKVKIENKPYIKGFEIDIYVPELRKGIEFDGLYHHSFNGLKRGRPNWPDDDIKNYHQIKDEYFKNKGIGLFHIKEEEWNENKESCIKKCLEFLEKRNEF
jgi:very-short-patch-repair endonuclease